MDFRQASGCVDVDKGVAEETLCTRQTDQLTVGVADLSVRDELSVGDSKASAPRFVCSLTTGSITGMLQSHKVRN